MATLQNFDAEIAKTKQVVEDMRSKIEQSGTVLDKIARTDEKIGASDFDIENARIEDVLKQQKVMEGNIADLIIGLGAARAELRRLRGRKLRRAPVGDTLALILGMIVGNVVKPGAGLNIDPASLAFRDGDALLAAVRGRSNQQVAFLDSSGRAYSTPAHTLPSARGNGEPLTGRFSPPAGAAFTALTTGEDSQRLLVSTSHGYGFITRFGNLVGRQKAGKQFINPGAGAELLPPVSLGDAGDELLAAITSAGYLLVFPLSELPELDKGKGNKLIQIPPARLKDGQESLHLLACVRSGGELILHCGQRKLVLTWRDLQAYGGTRAQRGHLLPRGFQKVDRAISGDPG